MSIITHLLAFVAGITVAIIAMALLDVGEREEIYYYTWRDE